MVWSHLKKKRTKFLTHEVNGLLPGVRYKFQAPLALEKKRRWSRRSKHGDHVLIGVRR
jgi:hypothetical protein